MARTIVWDLEIAWDGTTYTNESTRLVSASGSIAVSPPGLSALAAQGIVGDMTLVLDNRDGRYSALNTSSPLYANIQAGKAYHRPVYLRVSIDNGSNYYRVFTGVIKIPQESGATYSETSIVTITCRDRSELLLNKRISTTSSIFKDYVDTGYDESYWIARFLFDSGLSAPTDYVSQYYKIYVDPLSTATLDPGMFVIPFAWLDDESPIEDCWTLAAACGGRFYCGRDGLFYYENATNWLGKTSAMTLDTNDFSMSQPMYDDVELYSGITVETSPRKVAAPDILWQPDEDVVVPANTTKTVVAQFDVPAYTVTAVNYSAVTHGGLDITSSVSVATTSYAQRASLEITNSHASHAAVLRGLSITGRPVEGSPSQEETATSVDSFWTGRGTRTRRISGNPYVQTKAQASMLAAHLRDAHEVPRPTFQLRGVPGQPSLWTGNRITVQDASLMSASRDVFISEIRWRLDGSGFVQDITGIDAVGLYPSHPTPGYFVLDTNKLDAAPTGDNTVLFY